VKKKELKKKNLDNFINDDGDGESDEYKEDLEMNADEDFISDEESNKKKKRGKRGAGAKSGTRAKKPAKDNKEWEVAFDENEKDPSAEAKPKK
jgi:hypothetical protein